MNKYTMVYNYFKEKIEKGDLKQNSKMPSLRKATQIFSVSETTIENAYFELEAAGYIISVAKRGFFVAYNSQNIVGEVKTTTAEKKIEFDFTGDIADEKSFDLNLWRRYIKSALRQSERMLSYSAPNGERDLRQALCEYVKEKRNVITSPDKIIIGAGIYPLLNVFCTLIDEKGTASFPDKSFTQGSAIFKNFGFDVHYRFKDAGIIYVSPSHMTKWGDVMPNKRRMELVNYSAKNGELVIEDDYESEFQYNKKPLPSLYALSGGKNVVYLGSFSKVLLPSIRISFMILTDNLAKKYFENYDLFFQTASKTEQIALCSMIRDGNLNAQIKKSRRFYTTKNLKFYNKLKEVFPDADITISENSLSVLLRIKREKEADFEKFGLKPVIKDFSGGKMTLFLNCSAIPEEKLANAVSRLKKCLD